MIGNLICGLITFVALVVFYLMIGFVVADLTKPWHYEAKRKGSTVLFWPWVLIKLAYKNIRGMGDGWEW